jgi:hypothetical protein
MWSDVLDRLQDVAIRPHEDDVAAAADELGDKLASAGLPIEMERQNPLPGWLRGVHQVATAHPLAQQEEQGRGRLHTATELLGHEEHPRLLRIGRD